MQTVICPPDTAVHTLHQVVSPFYCKTYNTVCTMKMYGLKKLSKLSCVETAGFSMF